MVSSVFIVSILSLGAVFCSPLLTSENVKEDEDGLSIIKGNYTRIEEYPRNVAFLVANDIWGAGVIINSSWILTTAFNCLWVDASFITVRVGSSNWTKEGVIIPATACVMHPNYTGTWANNIALLKLDRDIEYGPKSRKGQYHPSESLKIANNTYDVTGWGVRSPNYVKETQLQKTSQTVLDDTECSKFYNLTGGNFCASNPKGGPCVFDFGAPLNKKKIVVGLYQGSIDCTQPQTYPALYVDVYQFSDWITSVMTNY